MPAAHPLLLAYATQRQKKQGRQKSVCSIEKINVPFLFTVKHPSPLIKPNIQLSSKFSDDPCLFNSIRFLDSDSLQKLYSVTTEFSTLNFLYSSKLSNLFILFYLIYLFLINYIFDVDLK
jgi:hypothetical protein